MYLESLENVGIENDGFSYTKMVDYINGIGNFWIKLVEQFIPATTLWNTGTRIENSIFHRQKFAYRMQRGCLPLEVQILGPQVLGGFAPQGCPASLMSLVLKYDGNVIQSNLGTLSKTIDCNKLSPTVKSLNYGFQLVVVKNGVTYTFDYTDPQVYSYPNQVINGTQWTTFIVQGLSYLMGELIGVGLTASYEFNELTITSEDCTIIESIDFNLEYKNVNFTCL